MQSSTPPSHLPTRPASSAQRPLAVSHTALQRSYSPLDEKRAYYDHDMSSSSPTGFSTVSAARSSILTSHTLDTVDLEKAATDRRASRLSSMSRQKKTWPRNPYPASEASIPCDRASLSSTIADDDARYILDERRHLEDKAMKILLFLSGPCALLSGLLAFWTFVATLLLCITQPFRLCMTDSPSLHDRLLSTLSSALRLQFRAIYSPTASTTGGAAQGNSVPALLLVHFLNPLLSIGVAIAAWTVAIYWLFAAIVGDPDGTEGGDDGKATVLGLRGWWVRWLAKALVEG